MKRLTSSVIFENNEIALQCQAKRKKNTDT